MAFAKPSLTFLGAAGTVTGAKHLLEVRGKRILIDCGLFQGLKDLRLRNWRPFPIAPSSIDAVVLTHAHLDHSGYLPRLVSAGYHGRVWCTGGTKDLCSLVLPDSARIQEEDARAANRGRYAKHDPALPLYTSLEAERALTRLQPVGYERRMPIADGIEVDFIDAGHLLGSAYVRIHVDGQVIVFGGDLGRYGRPVLPDPSPIAEADALLIESTYGDRLHEADDDGARLASIVSDTAARGGKLIIPAFAIGRVEEVLYWLKRLEDEQRIPVLPVYVDSPMAIAALQFYAARSGDLDPPAVDQASVAAHTPVRAMARFATARLTTVASAQQSADLVASRKPAIVIASSGMATGGRVLHHLAATLPDARHTILFVGFQAPGTRGRSLVDGAKQLRIAGRDIAVAARVEKIDSMSAHADYSEMLRWLSGFSRPPKMTYLVHGEPPALEALAARVADEKHWPVHIARDLERVELP